MAMCTYVQMVTDDEIATLAKKPETINELDKPKTYSTYLFTVINYFLCGSPYPTRKHKLAAVLMGEKNIETSTLENGSFDVTSSKTVAALAKEMAKLDLDAIREKIEEADFDELRDDEVDEEEVLSSSDDPVKEILDDIASLQKFFAMAAKEKKGLAIYTA